MVAEDSAAPSVIFGGEWKVDRAGWPAPFPACGTFSQRCLPGSPAQPPRRVPPILPANLPYRLFSFARRELRQRAIAARVVRVNPLPGVFICVRIRQPLVASAAREGTG